jgi:hypothetical protein
LLESQYGRGKINDDGDTVRDSRLSAYRISKDTGLVVTSIIRFVDGETSLRLDKADVLAEYLGLEPMQRKTM